MQLSNIDVNTVKLRLLYKVAVTKHQGLDARQVRLIQSTLQVVVYWQRSRLITASSTGCIVLRGLSLLLLIQNLRFLCPEDLRAHGSRVELDPLWRQHEVNVLVILVAPVLEDFSHFKLSNHLVRRDQRVHVRLEAQLCVDGLLVELNLDKAVWVGADDEVDLGPVDHDHLLDVVDDVRQLVLVDLLQSAIVGTWLEVAMQDLVLVKPLGLEDFIVCDLVGVVVRKIRQDVIFLGVRMSKAVLILPCKSQKTFYLHLY